MATSSINSASVPAEAKVTKNRYKWTKEEELALIDALKDLKGKGMKVDNAFRAGYLLKLEAAIKKVIPSSTVHVDPQVRSKMTVWKRTYGHLYLMFDVTGGGSWLCPLTKTIQCTSEEYWDDYVKVHPYMIQYKDKSFPYFDDWAEIFGKDKATGKAAEDLTAAMDDRMNGNDDEEPTHGGISGHNASPQSGPTYVDLDMDEGHGDNDAPASSGPSKSSSKKVLKKIKKEKGQKRRRESLPAEDSAPQVPAYVNEFIKMNDTMDRIAQICVAPKVTEDPARTQRKSLYGVVAVMTEFDEDQKIEIVHMLAHSPEDADVIFGLPESSRVKYLKHIMKKKAGRV